jgi:predicted DNA-binding ribbon-helix-helix protein
MCELYVKADPMLYESRSRSLRIHGAVTRIRLENLFWDILAELAAADGYTTNQLIVRLYDELVEYRGEIDNFASFLRVSCLRYLTLRKGSGERPALAVVGARASA